MNVRLVGICGASATGKTWLVAELMQRIGSGCGLLSLDAFYLDRAHLAPARREYINFDHPRAIDWPLFRQVLCRVLEGRPVAVPQYDFSTHTRKVEWRRVLPTPLMLVEGLWVWHRREVRGLLARRIFLTCSWQERLLRRVRRDVVERGRTEAEVRRQFATQVEPMSRQFVSPLRRHADLVLESPVGIGEVERLVADLRALAV